MFQSNKNSSNSLGSILAPEIEINGDINVAGNVIVYGKVFGSIKSTGTVNTAKGSFIEGNVDAKDLFISGKITGNINIENKVVLGSSGELTGNIEAAIITIEEGANFDGMCNMLKGVESKVKKISTINA